VHFTDSPPTGRATNRKFYILLAVTSAISALFYYGFSWHYPTNTCTAHATSSHDWNFSVYDTLLSSPLDVSIPLDGLKVSRLSYRTKDRLTRSRALPTCFPNYPNQGQMYPSAMVPYHQHTPTVSSAMVPYHQHTPAVSSGMVPYHQSYHQHMPTVGHFNPMDRPGPLRRRCCQLFVRQQPEDAMVANKGKGRKPIDPPPVVQLKVSAEFDPHQQWQQNPYVFMRASLAKADGSALDEDAVLTGSYVSSLHRLKDETNVEGGFFVFGDMSVTAVGTYILKFALYELLPEANIVKALAQAESREFTVKTAKDFGGLKESSFMTTLFSDQGVRLRLRKESRNSALGKRKASEVEDRDTHSPETKRSYAKREEGHPRHTPIPMASTPTRPSMPLPSRSSRPLAHAMQSNQTMSPAHTTQSGQTMSPAQAFPSVQNMSSTHTMRSVQTMTSFQQMPTYPQPYLQNDVYSMGFPHQYGPTGHSSDTYGSSDSGHFPNNYHDHTRF
jgi:hypothetical protein